MSEDDTIEDFSGFELGQQSRDPADVEVSPTPHERAAARTKRSVVHEEHLPRISSPEEAEALTEGSAFLGPDGVRRVVPYKVAGPEDINRVPDGSDFVGPDGVLRMKPKYQPIDFTTQYLYNAAHSDKGRRKALERTYSGKVRDDPSGGFFVEDEDGVFRKPGRGGAGVAGFLTERAAPTLGAIGGTMGGAALGIPALPAGGPLVAGSAGAFAGGAAGSKVNDIVASLAGVQDLISEEGATKDALIEGGLAAGGNVVGRGVGAAVHGFKTRADPKILPRMANHFLGTDEAALRAAIPMATRGAKPGKLGLDEAGTQVPPSQVIKEAPAIQNIVEFKEPALHTQDPLRMSREAHYERGVGEIIEGTGASARAGSAIKPQAAVSVEKAGEKFLDAVRDKAAAADAELDKQMARRTSAAKRKATIKQREIDELNKAAEESQKAAQQLVDGGFADLDRQVADALKVARAGHNTGDLWRTIGEQLNAYRAGIQARARLMYDNADELAGAVRNPETGIWEGGIKPDVKGLASRADAFLKQLPGEFEQKYPDVVRQLRDFAGKKDPKTGEWLVEPTQPTWSQLHNLRTYLRQNIKWNDLTSDVNNGTRKYFDNRVNDILHDTKATPGIKEASESLRRADGFYRENMGTLDSRQMQTIMDGLKSGMQADPKALLDVVLKDGKTEVAQQIEKIVGPATWNTVRAADTQEMMQVSRNLRGEIDGKKFAAEVLKRKNSGLLETLHGPGAKQLVDQAVQVEQLAGRLEIRAVPGDTMNDVLMRAHAARQAAEAAAKQDPIGTLKREIAGIQADHAIDMKAAREVNPFAFALDPTVGAHKAVDRILDHPDMLIAASRAFAGGDKSPEFELIRQVWTQRFLEQSRTNLRPAKQLAQTPPEIQDLMFPGVSLKQMHLFAREMELLVPKGGDGGKGIMKTNIQEHPIGAATGLGKLAGPAKALPGANAAARSMLGAYYGLVRHIATSPTTLRWLEKGLESTDPAARAAARQALQEFMAKTGRMGAGAGAAMGPPGPGVEQ